MYLSQSALSALLGLRGRHIFEMTLNYPVVLPRMLVCVLAYFVARSHGDASMY